ncbi:arginyl-tRNA--protein transferase 1 isoform X1 [Centruroides vittatus]|uniref:arginyl-tRNA--protein transferase 1 isoform X1 n=1 Tax=Centruroides vittatus TaxID=120091 RepID=UPI00351033A5
MSIVEYFSEHSGYRCGYCKSEDGSYSHGMWAHALTPTDYQDLINRGWRRSGMYCYKPTMNIACCPQYTIRCEALNFRPSKSQKKVLKKMHKFLAYGRTKDDVSNNESQMKSFESDSHFEYPDVVRMKDIASKVEKDLKDKEFEVRPDLGSVKNTSQNEHNVLGEESKIVKNVTVKTSSKKEGDHTNSDRPLPKKAKLMRKERKIQKLLEKAKQEGTSENVEQLLKKNQTKQKNKVKTLNDFLNEPLPENPAHRLQIRLVRSGLGNKEFEKTFSISHNIYAKYQMTIHGDPPDKCSEDQFTWFLVKSPLKSLSQPEKKSEFFCGYGSFHQQYWLDDNLIAVGVVDVLPHCVSSVYLYYDPSYSFLSLGTYAALREIAFTQELNRIVPELKYYYMGFYIHSCPKMRYKGNFEPSYLLCPEVYSWHPIEKCKPKLDISKYHRLNEDSNAEDKDGIVDIGQVQILYQRQWISYTNYRKMRKGDCNEAEVAEYARFVGRKCYSKMLLYRSSSK